MSCSGSIAEHPIADAPLGARLSELERRLLDDFQRDLPLVPRPFAAIAEHLGSDEATVLRHLRHLQQAGVVSRVGPVFRPNRVGASTLAAMRVPPARLETVAELVNGYPEVNHNYERDHTFNLWFVVAAESEEHLGRVLGEMEQRTGLPLLRLPMLEAYHLDLGFRMHLHEHRGGAARRLLTAARGRIAAARDDGRLIGAVQEGLPLVAAPYAAVGERAAMSEEAVIGRIGQWLEEGTLSRFGVVVRHRELGYRHNAMVVWDIPDERVAAVGRRFAQFDFVTLCYRRPRQPPLWRYNLFCMIHGRDRDAVLEKVKELATEAHLPAERHAVLFSQRRFKQCGARYRSGPTAGAQHGRPLPRAGRPLHV